MKKSEDLRTCFVKYFEKNGHTHLDSSKLVPSNDPTLLFTNAGMVQFKKWFTGEEKPKYQNVVTYQKCIRAGGKHNDLDNVGFTPRHHTFFEMLGNFSFGSYFKEESINLAWNFLVNELGIDKKRLYLTVFEKDKISYDLWKKISGFKESRIIKISTDDNFWSMGDSGPCGPCSEIFFDQGENISGGLPGSKNQDGPRFVEIWNLVFMEFNRKNGKFMNLPKKCVDTGMGLERILAILNGKHNNFETDFFLDLIDFISQSINIKITKNNIHSFRIIADHIRAIVFILSEGILPSNEGRGYVLRRIIRRASRQLSEMNYNEIFLYKLVNLICKSFKNAYGELENAEDFITATLKQEEKNFSKTIHEGNKLLFEEIRKCKTKTFPAELIFKLYDTYGFPVDLTEIILKRNNFLINKNEINSFFLDQREKSKKTWSGSGQELRSNFFLKLKEDFNPTKFTGYKSNISNSKVLALIYNEKFMQKVKSQKNVSVIFESTPFYAESGGQVGDTGYIKKNNQKIFKVVDTKKFDGDIYVHYLENLGENELTVDLNYDLEINVERRKNITNNHSATHLLHESLRRVLGKHVNQKGSLVAQKKLRFDFTSPKGLDDNEIKEVEKIVNKSIRENLKINILSLPLKEAFDGGAIGLFGEKYPEIVRVVKMNNEKNSATFFSSELCGGTHVSYTGEIGYFKILSESSVSSGVRRIEAITGDYVSEYIDYNQTLINNVRRELKIDNDNLVEKIKNLKEDISKLKNKNNKSLDDSIDKSFVKDVNKKSLYVQEIELPSKEIKKYMDSVKTILSPDVILLITTEKSKVTLLVNIKNPEKTKINAVDIIKKLVTLIGGKGGGGRPELAQGGGPDRNGIKKIIKKIEELI